MYCDYWNLHKAPFDNVPDPSMYADCHTTMENVIAETIFAIKETDESFAVIIGEPGSGKTLSLKIIMDSLEPEKYKTILLNNPGASFLDLLKEIIDQIKGIPCDENRKNVLLETFRQLLLDAGRQGQKIVIFIDEANALSPANLENLRLLANMQDTPNYLFTIVLAGPLELAKRLEHPKRANLFQRIGIYGRIDKLSSSEAVKNYIETRLKLAGTSIKIFSDDSIPVIWEHSEHGIPRLINKICKLCLKAGETNGFDYVSGEIAWQVAQRFERLGNTALQKRKPRGRPDGIDISEIILPETNDTEESSGKYEEIEQTSSSLIAEDLHTDTPPSLLEIKPVEKTPSQELTLESQTSSCMLDEQPPIQEKVFSEEILEQQPEKETMPDQDANAHVPNQDEILSAQDDSDNEDEPKKNAEEDVPSAMQDNHDEVQIGKHRVKLDIPKDILKQVKSFNRESAIKSAGFWAAQIIKKNPELTCSPLADPVQIWHEIKDSILKRISL